MHLGDPQVDKLMSENPTVVPIRHPDLVATSWASRKMDLDVLSRQWDQMVLFTDVIFLPVDSPKYREDQLHKIEDLAGVKLITSWRPSHAMPLNRIAATFKNCDSFRTSWW